VFNDVCDSGCWKSLDFYVFFCCCLFVVIASSVFYAWIMVLWLDFVVFFNGYVMCLFSVVPLFSLLFFRVLFFFLV
jgi:hypothetical protein